MVVGDKVGKAFSALYTWKEFLLRKEEQTSQLNSHVVISLISRKKGDWEYFGAHSHVRKPAYKHCWPPHQLQTVPACLSPKQWRTLPWASGLQQGVRQGPQGIQGPEGSMVAGSKSLRPSPPGSVKGGGSQLLPLKSNLVLTLNPCLPPTGCSQPHSVQQEYEQVCARETRGLLWRLLCFDIRLQHGSPEDSTPSSFWLFLLLVGSDRLKVSLKTPPPCPSPFSLTNVFPNKIPALLMPSWHLFLGEPRLSQDPTIKTH